MGISKNNKTSLIKNNKTNKLTEINKDFELLKEWIKMVNIPFKSNLESVTNEIFDEDLKAKIKNKSINFNNYTDKCLEEKLEAFYKNNKSKFKKNYIKVPQIASGLYHGV